MQSKQTITCTDAIVEKTTRVLLQCLDLDSQYTGDPRSWTMKWTPLNAAEFKRHHQAVSWLKKYTFSHEKVDAARYEAEAIEEFVRIQDRLRDFKYDPCPFTRDVVMYARGWLQNVLGEYDREEHLESCYFPRKASVGNPMAKSTLEAKWTTGLTGSSYHSEWFDHVYKLWHGHSLEDGNLQPFEVDCLQATLVPKRFNKRRMIVPNTAIGGLYTNGLGRMYEKRLSDSGLRINHLQEKHRSLARRASLTGRLATIDQKTASDNIGTWHVRLLLPHRWAYVTLAGRIALIKCAGDVIDTLTCSTMGIGHTFPLQTLIFLAITHGVLQLREEQGLRVRDRTVSCFGDDLICPVEIREDLERTFSQLGLVINTDKSYWSGPFRESCGGDYFRGTNVRPAFVPAGGDLGKRGYECFLYKLFNAVKRRWSVEEVGSVLHEIIRELRLVKGREPLIVPPRFGADNGLQLTVEEINTLGLQLPTRNVHGVHTFDVLTKKPERIKIDDTRYHYWWSLQHSRAFASHVSRRACDGAHPGPLVVSHPQEITWWELQETSQSVSGYTPPLIWEQLDKKEQPKNYRSKITGKKLMKTQPCVASSGDAGRYQYDCREAADWDWDPSL